MFLKSITLEEDKKDVLYQTEDCHQILDTYKEYYSKIGYNKPWTGYFIVNNNEVVGTCGFTGSPANNTVEIAYYTFKKFEGKGFAGFACRELISIAKRAQPDIIIIAKTAPEQNASTKILEHNNFEFSGIVEDHEIGNAWLWTLKNN